MSTSAQSPASAQALPDIRSKRTGLLVRGGLSVVLLIAAAWAAYALYAPTRNAPGVPAALAAARSHGVVKLGVDYAPPPLLPSDYETRREEGFEAQIAEDFKSLWGVEVRLVPVAAADRASFLRDGRVDALLVNVDARNPSADLAANLATTVEAGYESSLSAIMRSDTTIRSWQDLAGRKVCIAAGNERARIQAERIGAVIDMEKAPAKTLAKVRTGECDAAIHDTELVRRLIQLPNGNWKKFSATLRATNAHSLTFAARAGDNASKKMLQEVTQRWDRSRQWSAWVNKWTADIDFETYLEQDAPDCH